MPANELLLLLESGPVRIKLRPDLAPHHVERVCTLAAEGFYDGVPFDAVNPQFMVQATPLAPSSYPDLKAEFSDVRTLRKACVMARGVDPDSANSAFFIVVNDAAFIPCQYTVWGEVVEGIERLDALPPGEPPAEPGRILSLRIVDQDA